MDGLLLKNGKVVDPVNNIDTNMDILIKHGVIYDIAQSLPPGMIDEVIDLHGKVVIAGIIDMHVHLCGNLNAGYKMLAKSGVTTAIDFSGPVDEVVRGLREKGTGISVGVMNGLIPGSNISKGTCSFDEIRDAVDKSMIEGSLGIKILGGHYPLTSENSLRTIEYCNSINAYIAFHAGTMEVREPFPAFKQAAGFAEGKRLHIAHVNSYCRGRYKNYIDEMAEAMGILDENSNIHSDSYISSFNGTDGSFVNGEFTSRVTRTELEKGGYPPTETGLKNAVMDGYVLVCKEKNGENMLVSGMEGFEHWKLAKSEITLSFNVNPSINSIAFVMHKDKSNKFTVDALSTDGGGIHRNVIIRQGLPLTAYSGFDMKDFVRKVSVNPARLLGLKNKGHLAVGADADITVIDMMECKPYMAVANGEVIMLDGCVMGSGGRMIITERGESYIKAETLDYILSDVHIR